MVLLLTLHWPEQVVWPYHIPVVLPYSCSLMERGTGLMNTCNVSHIVNLENLIFFNMLRCQLHIQLKMSVNNYRYKG